MYLCTFEFWRLQVAMLRSAKLPNMEEGLARFAIEVSGHKEFYYNKKFVSASWQNYCMNAYCTSLFNLNLKI
jgi:hypothetical protein